jgi:TP901 family phage tail tape measure protein
VQAISGASAEEMEVLKNTAKEYGKTTKFSASESADALSYMALAGWDATQSADALGGVLDLASASGMDLAQASDMVTDYLTAFGMSAEESGYFADVLAYAQSNAI